MRNNVTRHAPGERFGRLTIVAEDPTPYPDRKVRWICRCDCGTVKSINGRYLRSGDTRSCGCMGDEHRRSSRPRGVKHGLWRTPEYRTWVRMRQRCRDPKTNSYHRYGGRGIKVAPEWESFERFLADMGPRPSPEHSIDRIDNDGPYSPGNCRWATRTEQMGNRRTCIRLTHDGKTQALAAWARDLGISIHTLRHRVSLGWPPERILER